MAEVPKKRRGPVSLFPGKRRAPVSLTLTPDHHKKVETNTRRIGITRADFIGLLIEKYADIVLPTLGDQPYKEVRDAIAALGGTLEHHKFGGPRGESWVLDLAGKRLLVRKDGGTYPALEACYLPASAEEANTPSARRAIDLAGLAALLRALESS